MHERLVGIQPSSLDGIPDYRTPNAIGRYEESSERAETGKLDSKLLRQLWGKAEVASFLPQIASHPDSKTKDALAKRMQPHSGLVTLLTPAARGKRW
jgi:hypothetical protein